MKYCPTCQSQYTDDTLKFCLQDGSPLQSAFSPQTAALETGGPETETVVAARPTDEVYVPRATQPPSPVAPPVAGSSNTAKAVFLTAFLMLLFFSLAGIGLWFYFRGLSGDRNANMVLANANRPNQPSARNSPRASEAASNATPSATTAANTAANVNAAGNASPSPPVDREEIRREVGERIDEWRADTESFDLNDYMSHYADTVDYYTRKGASRAFVRGDKERAFARFDDVRMEISNLTVTPDAGGERATAVFDKEWEFSGSDARSAGKVQTQLQLRKIGGRWLITSERDLKVYRTE